MENSEFRYGYGRAGRLRLKEELAALVASCDADELVSEAEDFANSCHKGSGSGGGQFCGVQEGDVSPGVYTGKLLKGFENVPINSGGYINRITGKNGHIPKDEKYGFLMDSNALYPVEWEGIRYPSGEHALQASRTQNVKLRREIAKSSVVKAKSLAHIRPEDFAEGKKTGKIPDRFKEAKIGGKVTAADYPTQAEEIKSRESIQIAKFDQNPSLKALLVGTGKDVISESKTGSRINHAEYDPNKLDSYWDGNPDGTGGGTAKNGYGKLLMDLRKRFKGERIKGKVQSESEVIKNSTEANKINDEIVKTGKWNPTTKTKLLASGNPNHKPAGPGGGQFTSGEEGDSAPTLKTTNGVRYDPKVVRAWAKKNYPGGVADIGKIKPDIFKEYAKSLKTNVTNVVEKSPSPSNSLNTRGRPPLPGSEKAQARINAIERVFGTGSAEHLEAIRRFSGNGTAIPKTEIITHIAKPKTTTNTSLEGSGVTDPTGKVWPDGKVSGQLKGPDGLSNYKPIPSEKAIQVNGRWYVKDYVYLPDKISHDQANQTASSASARVRELERPATSSDLSVIGEANKSDSQGHPNLLTDTSGKERTLRSTKIGSGELTGSFTGYWSGLRPEEKQSILDYMWNSKGINSAIAGARRTGGDIDFASMKGAMSTHSGSTTHLKGFKDMGTKTAYSTVAPILERALKNAPVLSKPVTVWRGLKLDPSIPGQKRVLDTINALGAGSRKNIDAKKDLLTDYIMNNVVKTHSSNKTAIIHPRGITSTSLDPRVAAKFATPKLDSPSPRLTEKNKGVITQVGGPRTKINMHEFGGVILQIEARKAAYIAPAGKKLPGKLVTTLSGTATHVRLEKQEEVLLPFDSKLQVVDVVRNVLIADSYYGGKAKEYTVIRVRQII